MGRTPDIVTKLRARRESVYDGKSQDHHWVEDALCQEAATLITSLREALEEWQSAREAFIGMNATGGKEALNRLSEAEDKLSSIARLNPSRKETI